MSTLMSSKDDLEATQKSAYQLLRKCHITEIMEKKKEKLQELDAACQSSKNIFHGNPIEDLFDRWRLNDRFNTGMYFFLRSLVHKFFLLQNSTKLPNNDILLLIVICNNSIRGFIPSF